MELWSREGVGMPTKQENAERSARIKRMQAENSMRAPVVSSQLKLYQKENKALRNEIGRLLSENAEMKEYLKYKLNKNKDYLQEIWKTLGSVVRSFKKIELELQSMEREFDGGGVDLYSEMRGYLAESVKGVKDSQLKIQKMQMGTHKFKEAKPPGEKERKMQTPGAAGGVMQRSGTASRTLSSKIDAGLGQSAFVQCLQSSSISLFPAHLNVELRKRYTQPPAPWKGLS
eukprot:1534360-Rhodomonas_salina.1